MRIDLQRTDSWHKANAAYAEVLGLTESQLQVQLYPGVKAALWEVCTQLTQLVPNKRTIYYLKEAEPLFESVAVHLSREGFKVKALDAAELNNPSAWFEAIQRELLFIVDLQDEPVTGELYDFPELDKAIADKRTYRISVSHARHNSLQIAPPTQYRTNLLSIDLEKTVAILGERVRVQPPVASGMIWATPDKSKAKEELQITDNKTYEAQKQKVQAFEKSLPQGAKKVLQTENRLYDRAIISFDDLDGLSLITELSCELARELKPAGNKGPLETTSLCRWEDEKIWQGLVTKGFTQTQLRGLVAISAELIDDKLKSKIETARNHVLKQQQG
jgi:hypothetical protein